MSQSTTAMTSSASVYASRGFWERLWRTAGIQFVVFSIIVYVIYGDQPQIGASADSLVAFYHGDRIRILIAAVFAGLNVLNLMWFAAAIRTTLSDAGQDGWGSAATAASAALGGLFLLIIAVSAALANSIAGSGNNALTSGLNDFLWASVVLTSFPWPESVFAYEPTWSRLAQTAHLVNSWWAEDYKRESGLAAFVSSVATV